MRGAGIPTTLPPLARGWPVVEKPECVPLGGLLTGDGDVLSGSIGVCLVSNGNVGTGINSSSSGSSKKKVSGGSWPAVSVNEMITYQDAKQEVTTYVPKLYSSSTDVCQIHIG